MGGAYSFDARVERPAGFRPFALSTGAYLRKEQNRVRLEFITVTGEP